ncbi:uncharacterized protein [Haliotis asinina]|uniref:uncharacterized protein n=1 Tax=Haliotis asinina TaxID=109174 RepID=UPI0035319087
MEIYYRSSNVCFQRKRDTCDQGMKENSLIPRQRLYSCSEDEDRGQDNDADSCGHAEDANSVMDEGQINRMSRLFLEEFDRRFRGKSEDFDFVESRTPSVNSSDLDNDSNKQDHDEEDGKSKKKGSGSKATSGEGKKLSKEAWLLRERMWNAIDRDELSPSETERLLTGSRTSLNAGGHKSLRKVIPSLAILK